MISKRILPGERLDDALMDVILEDFFRNGVTLIPGVLTREEIDALREVTDRCFNDPVLAGTDYVSGQGDGFVLRNTLELDAVFVDMLVREPILSLAEAVVGEDCKFCGQNVIRNAPGQAIDLWHVDDRVEFPLPDDVPRHDPRIRMPVQWFTIQMALTDIDTVEDGPTQFVPGSHYSGRDPNSQEHPEFEGRGPVSVFCKAGDVYLQNNQCWHRGAPVTSDRMRYVFQSQYSARWAHRRFSEYHHVPVPPTVLSRASDRLRGVLGV
ncbi:MAG: phytanoyl-CoA dioxygenase family protein [candidate division Zixibacteria bacterium]|nr:phytanoyl-CoA dioxygenase family protein [candidate division Zixibacteria bacterium]